MITTTWWKGLAVLGAVGWLGWGAGCVAPIDTGASPCPCADGWTCCGQNLCVPEGTACPDCDRCERETTRCQAQGAQRCEVPADGCADWGAVTPCPEGQICDLGVCRCPDVCGAGTGRCVEGGGYQECVEQADGCWGWAPAAPCPQGLGCAGGRCVEGCLEECVVDERRCDDLAGAVQVCLHVPDGCHRWELEQDCPDGTACLAGRCVDVSCGDGALQPRKEVCDGLDNDCDGITDELELTGISHWPQGSFHSAVPVGDTLYVASDYGIEVFVGNQGVPAEFHRVFVLPMRVGDVWYWRRHLATNGKEVFVLEDFNHWIVLDAFNPPRPQFLTRVESTQGYLLDLKVVGDTVLAFSSRYHVAGDASEVVLDVYQLQADRIPKWTQSFSLGLTAPGQDWTFGVAQAGNLLAVAKAGFHLLQVSPAGDVAVFGPFEVGSKLEQLTMTPSLLFAVEAATPEVRGFDIHALSSPRRVPAALPFPDVESYLAPSVVVTDRFLVVCNAVYDLQDLASPVWKDDAALTSLCQAPMYAAGGDRILILDWNTWSVLELMPPSQPRIFAAFQPVPLAVVQAEPVGWLDAVAVGYDWIGGRQPWVLTLFSVDVYDEVAHCMSTLLQQGVPSADQPRISALRVYNQHAFVAHNEGLWISDITELGFPQDVRTDYELANLAAMEIREDGLLVGAQGGSLVTADVRVPALAARLGSVAVCEPYLTSSLAILGDIVVMPCGPSTFLVDIADPAQPAVLSTVDVEVKAVAGIGNLVVGSGPSAQGLCALEVLDLSDPANPKKLAPIPIEGTIFNLINLENGFLLQTDTGMITLPIGASGLAPPRLVDLLSAPLQNSGGFRSGLRYGYEMVLAISENRIGAGITRYWIEGCLP